MNNYILIYFKEEKQILTLPEVVPQAYFSIYEKGRDTVGIPTNKDTQTSV